MLSRKQQALALYLVLRRKGDTTHAWQRFYAWWRHCPENQQAFREIEDEQRALKAIEAANGYPRSAPDKSTAAAHPTTHNQVIVEARLASALRIVQQTRSTPQYGISLLLMLSSAISLSLIPAKPTVDGVGAASVDRVGWSREIAGPHETVRTVRLSDDSTVQLVADSVLDWRMTRERRELSLERGRAVFAVSHDERPFEVKAGRAQVVALGTVFSVALENEAIVTKVNKGNVIVIPVPSQERVVSAGHTAWVQGNRFHMEPTSASSGAKLQIQDGDFNFTRYPLGAAVDAFNHLNRGLQLAIADPLLETETVGGAFPADDPQGFADALEKMQIASVERADNSAVIRLRAFVHTTMSARQRE